jgi:hypothetical protein
MQPLFSNALSKAVERQNSGHQARETPGERWLASRIPNLLLDLGAALYRSPPPLVVAVATTVLKRVGLHEGWISIVACVMISIIVSKIACVLVERRMTRYLNRRLL